MEGIFDVAGLIGDVTNWLLGLIPVGGGGAFAYHAFAKNAATEETTVAQHSRSQKNILIGTLIGAGAVGLVKYVAGYAIAP